MTEYDSASAPGARRAYRGADGAELSRAALSWRAIWLYGAIGVSAALVIASVAAQQVEGRWGRILFQVDLGNENNPAAWWSAALLALAALHAFDGRRALAARAPSAARGWGLIAAILAFLSLDEIGSLHERIAMLGTLSPLANPWPALAPVAAVLGGAFAIAVQAFWRAGGAHRRVLPALFIGFGCFGLVAGQEFLEHRLFWGDGWVAALRLAVEEGTELVGFLILFAAALGNTAGVSNRRGAAAPDRAFAALAAHWRGCLGLGAVLAPGLAVASVAMFAPGWGTPADWLAATAFLAAALARIAPALEAGVRPGPGLLGLAALCGAASVGVVSLDPRESLALGAVDVNARLVWLGGASAVILAIVLRDRPGRAFLAAAMAAALAAGAATVGRLDGVYLVSQLLGLAVFGSVAQRLGRIRVEPAAGEGATGRAVR